MHTKEDERSQPGDAMHHKGKMRRTSPVFDVTHCAVEDILDHSLLSERDLLGLYLPFLTPQILCTCEIRNQ